jgi:hypothetical protein
MKFMKTLIAAAGFLALAAGSFAQTAASQESAPTFGYMDAKTGMFHTLSRPLPSAETPAVTPTTGKIVFNVTITISSALPANAVITCLATGGVADAATGEFSMLPRSPRRRRVRPRLVRSAFLIRGTWRLQPRTLWNSTSAWRRHRARSEAQLSMKRHSRLRRSPSRCQPTAPPRQRRSRPRFSSGQRFADYDALAKARAFSLSVKR